MQNFVKIASVSEERKDKNGRVFKIIVVSSNNSREITDPVTGEVFHAVGKPKKSSIVAYQKTYLDETPHYLYDLPVGTAVNGNIVTKSVEPYDIETKQGTKTLTRYTTFVEADKDDPEFDAIVERVFENSGHVITSPNFGVPTAKPAPVDAKDAFDAPEDSNEQEEQEEANEEKKVPVMSDGEESEFEDEF